jgi:hypothetical protein
MPLALLDLDKERMIFFPETKLNSEAYENNILIIGGSWRKQAI